MNVERSERGRRNSAILWGVFLILLGGLFLFNRMGIADIRGMVEMWPLVLVMIGAGHMVEGKFGGGITWLVIGVWCMACNYDWLGLTYWNSWPVCLIAGGLGTVIAVFTREDDSPKKGGAS